MNITSASLNVQALIQSQAVKTDDPLSHTIDAAEFRRKLKMYNEPDDIIIAGKSLEYDDEEDDDRLELDGLDEHEEDKKLEVQLDKLNKINTLYGQRFRY